MRESEEGFYGAAVLQSPKCSYFSNFCILNKILAFAVKSFNFLNHLSNAVVFSIRNMINMFPDGYRFIKKILKSLIISQIGISFKMKYSGQDFAMFKNLKFFHRDQKLNPKLKAEI